MAEHPMTLPSNEELRALFNQHRGAFEMGMGLTFTRVTPDELECVVPVGPQLTQPYGLVHGGVYCAIVETVASCGAAIHAMSQGQNTVGLENTTSFVRGVRGGNLTAIGRPVHRGRQTQVWEVTIRDDAGKVAATGRVRLLSLEPGASIGGETVGLK